MVDFSLPILSFRFAYEQKKLIEQISDIFLFFGNFSSDFSGPFQRDSTGKVENRRC